VKICCTENDTKDQNTLWNILMVSCMMIVTNRDKWSIQNKCADASSSYLSAKYTYQGKSMMINRIELSKQKGKIYSDIPKK
jgi:hypothetical protein